MPDIDRQKYLDWVALKQQKTPLGVGPSDIPRQGIDPKLIVNREQEILILSANDSLGALIKAIALEDYSKSQIELLRLKANEFDQKIISFGIAGFCKAGLRRKQRDIRRRLLISLLSKKAGHSPDDLKGSKIKVLINLAKAKKIL